MFDYLPLVYAAYAGVTVGLTVWLAKVLSSSGEVFLADVFPENPELGAAVNKLLVVGFYLVNLGYAARMLSGGNATDVRSAIEVLSMKLGALLLSLAAMHFVNMFILHRIRRRSQRSKSLPVPPQGVVPMAGVTA